jgi:hypothetical protein
MFMLRSIGAIGPMRSTAVGLALAIGLAVLPACEGRLTEPAAPEPAKGQVRFTLGLAEDVDVDEVAYNITRAGGFEQSGTIALLANGNVFRALLMLPAASAYTLELSATTAQGASCSGHARFDVWPERKTGVNVLMRCAAPPQPGTADLNGTFNVCPYIDAVLALPDHAAIGGSVELHGSARDPDDPNAALTYEWTASSGVLMDATAPVTLLRCTEPGVALIGLKVSDGDVGCDVTSSGFEVTCEAATAPGPGDSGDVADTDAGAGL